MDIASQPPELYSLGESARRLGITRQSLLARINRGKTRAVKIGAENGKVIYAIDARTFGENPNGEWRRIKQAQRADARRERERTPPKPPCAVCAFVGERKRSHKRINQLGGAALCKYHADAYENAHPNSPARFLMENLHSRGQLQIAAD